LLAEVRLLFAPGSLAHATWSNRRRRYAQWPREDLNLAAVGRRYSGRLTLRALELKGDNLPVQMVYSSATARRITGKPRNHLISFSGRSPSFTRHCPTSRAASVAWKQHSQRPRFHDSVTATGLQITITGTVESGAPKARSIQIVDGGETFVANSVDTVPENYRQQVQRSWRINNSRLVKPPAAGGQTGKPARTAHRDSLPQRSFRRNCRRLPTSLLRFRRASQRHARVWRDERSVAFSKDGTTGAPKKCGSSRRHLSPKAGDASAQAPEFTSSCTAGKQAAISRQRGHRRWYEVVLFAAVFTVWGDGKKLFESKYVAHNHFRTQECSADVTGVDVLELRVQVVNGNTAFMPSGSNPAVAEEDTPDK